MFLTMQGIILFMFESAENPYMNYDNAISIMDVEPPPAPNFSSEPFAFIGNAVESANYAVAVTVYTVRLIISLISFPFTVASRVITFNLQYPFLLIINGTIIGFLAYSVVSRITGGD